jgi:hypothetical protein
MDFPRFLHPLKCSERLMGLPLAPLAFHCWKLPLPVMLGPLQLYEFRVYEPLLVLYEPALEPPPLPM